MPSSEYWAGFFDGEGCVHLMNRPGRTQLMLSVANTNKAVLELLQQDFGGNLSLNAKGYWAWQCTSHDAVRVLEALYPHLQIKREQARLALAYSQELVEERERRGGYYRNGLTSEERAMRARYAEQIKLLKRNQDV